MTFAVDHSIADRRHSWNTLSEWSRNRASESYFFHLEVQLLEKVSELGSQSGWTRLLAPPVGISLAAIELIKTVACIGEAIFKGLLNILGRPFSASFNLRLGVEILVGGSSAAVVAGAVNCAVGIVLSCGIFIFPDWRPFHPFGDRPVGFV